MNKILQNKKISAFFIISFFSLYSVFSLGYNVNFELDAGIAECITGDQVKENKNFWEDFENVTDYINAGGMLSVDVVFKQNLSAMVGLEVKNNNLNYLTNDGNEYGNGIVKLNYQTIQLPVMIKYSFPLKKTTDVISSIDVAGGVNVSYILGRQSYKDNITNYVGNFIINPFNVGISARAAFSHKIGPGKAYAGLKTDINLLPQTYTISGRKVNYGRVIFVAPVIGYTFILKEDKGLAKITEKNKRIKDIDVR